MPINNNNNSKQQTHLQLSEVTDYQQTSRCPCSSVAHAVAPRRQKSELSVSMCTILARVFLSLQA